MGNEMKTTDKHIKELDAKRALDAAEKELNGILSQYGEFDE